MTQTVHYMKKLPSEMTYWERVRLTMILLALLSPPILFMVGVISGN